MQYVLIFILIAVVVGLAGGKIIVSQPIPIQGFVLVCLGFVITCIGMFLVWVGINGKI